MIYDLTFTATPSYHHVTKSYRVPSLLQVSRSTRALYAKTFFGKGAVFILEALHDSPTLWKSFSSDVYTDEFSRVSSVKIYEMIHYDSSQIGIVETVRVCRADKSWMKD